MFRYIAPIILIGIAGTGFFMLTKPIIGDISTINTEVASYNEALNNAVALENERDKLTKKYNAINPDNLSKLQKLLPDNVDNIRLILEIEKLAKPYGMILKDVKYDSTASAPASPAAAGTGSQTASTTDTTNSSPIVVQNKLVQENKEYGTLNLEFSTEGTYSNFINFSKDIENNLRIVDISAVVFSSDTGLTIGKVKLTDSYRYDFKIKTYWLKN